MAAMKVWKSPVLYLGVLLVLAVAGALAAPFVLDWDGYRPRLEAYGEKLTGRKVEILGPIAVRLFPWPRLIADQVKIANIAGSEEPHILAAERVVVKLTPAALLNGAIKVEEIDIEKPAFVLERTEAGEVNWRLSPSEDIGKSRLLEQVQLDRISIKDGSLRFIDRRNGIDSGFRQMNFALAAPGIDGPWRARGTATHKSRAYEIGVNTGQHRAQEAFRFGFRVAPGDGSGVIVSFDGDYNGADVTGTTRIEPAASQDGKGDAEGALRPLVFVAKVKAGFDRIAFETIEIMARDTPNAATLVSGNAEIALGEKRGVSAELSAPRLDFDDLAGATTWLKIRNGDFLSLASGLFESMPEGLEVAGKFKVGLLRAGGENIENALIELGGNRDGLAISNLTASLPGRSRFLFRGDFAPGPVGADLKGILRSKPTISGKSQAGCGPKARRQSLRHGPGIVAASSWKARRRPRRGSFSFATRASNWTACPARSRSMQPMASARASRSISIPVPSTSTPMCQRAFPHSAAAGRRVLLQLRRRSPVPRRPATSGSLRSSRASVLMAWTRRMWQPSSPLARKGCKSANSKSAPSMARSWQ
ncbi:MAG: AsmA family protein [Rhizobiales bacterium]|nr:AsmA family protein [Hyphomicrobiales bacterium]